MCEYNGMSSFIARIGNICFVFSKIRLAAFIRKYLAGNISWCMQMSVDINYIRFRDYIGNFRASYYSRRYVE